MKYFFPDHYFHFATELSAEFFLTRGIKYVIFDIDDTLVAHGVPTAPAEIRSFLKDLQQAGITLGLISNSKGQRASVFNCSLDEPLFAIGHAGKPKKRALSAFFSHFPVSPQQVALVGDQLFTDVWLSKKWKILSVLVNPISPFENAFFYFKRALEKPILNAYFKHIERTNRTKEA